MKDCCCKTPHFPGSASFCENKADHFCGECVGDLQSENAILRTSIESLTKQLANLESRHTGLRGRADEEIGKLRAEAALQYNNDLESQLERNKAERERDAALLQVRDYCATTERQQEVINGLLLALRNMKKKLDGAHDGGCILPLRDMVNDALGVAVVEKPKRVCIDCKKELQHPDANLCLECVRKRWPSNDADKRKEGS